MKELSVLLSDHFAEKNYSSLITLNYRPKITGLEIKIYLKKFLDHL